MLKRTEYESDKRMLSRAELCTYVGLGENSAVKFAKEAKAERHIGTRVIYDKKLIDAALDALQEA